LINAYILVKVLGKQGRFVMTPEYHDIIAATPHVKKNVPRRLDFFGGAGRVAHLHRHLANGSLGGAVTRRWL
jgi:hypothetical protein